MFILSLSTWNTPTHTHTTNPTHPSFFCGSSCVLLQQGLVVCSPLKARFLCSNHSGSLGNLITRLKALSIRQITHSVWACVHVSVHPHCVRVCFWAYMVSLYAHVNADCPLNATPENPERQSAVRNFSFCILSLSLSSKIEINGGCIWSSSIMQRQISHKENQKKTKPLIF